MSPSLQSVASFEALCAAARRAARGKTLSLETALFLTDLETEVLALRTELLGRSYRPRSYRTFQVHDPKPRTISAAAFRDRVVHHALCAAVEPLFEARAIGDSYACRTGRGLARAIRRLQAFTRAGGWFVKIDVEHFFETADHEVLLEALRRVLRDDGLRWLSEVFVRAGAPGSPAGKGMPIGNLTSQHFANFYLTPLDHLLKGPLGLRRSIRYMDDIVFFLPDRRSAAEALSEVRRFVETRLVLRLKDAAMRQGPVSAGVPFLGFRVWPGLIRFDGARQRRWRKSVRRALADPDTDRSVRRLESLTAWSDHADARSFRRSFFSRLPTDERT